MGDFNPGSIISSGMNDITQGTKTVVQAVLTPLEQLEKGLLDSLGLAILPPGMLALAQMLDSGTAIKFLPILWSVLRARGAVWSILEDTVNAITSYGEYGVVRKLTENLWQPVWSVLDNVQANTKTLVTYHQERRDVLKNEIDALLAAGEMDQTAKNFGNEHQYLQSEFNELIQDLENASQAHSDLYTQLRYQIPEGAALALAGVDLVAVIVFVIGLTWATDGVDLLAIGAGAVFDPEAVFTGLIDFVGEVEAGARPIIEAVAWGAAQTSIILWQVRLNKSLNDRPPQETYITAHFNINAGATNVPVTGTGGTTPPSTVETLLGTSVYATLTGCGKGQCCVNDSIIQQYIAYFGGIGTGVGFVQDMVHFHPDACCEILRRLLPLAIHLQQEAAAGIVAYGASPESGLLTLENELRTTQDITPTQKNPPEPPKSANDFMGAFFALEWLSDPKNLPNVRVIEPIDPITGDKSADAILNDGTVIEFKSVVNPGAQIDGIQKKIDRWDESYPGHNMEFIFDGSKANGLPPAIRNLQRPASGNQGSIITTIYQPATPTPQQGG